MSCLSRRKPSLSVYRRRTVSQEATPGFDDEDDDEDEDDDRFRTPTPNTEHRTPILP